MPLKIDVYSIMRNEIKILPYFLRHYETFADRIFVWDDGSDDGTREMLEVHPKVTVIPVHCGGDDVYFVQRIWSRYRRISRGHADWAICVDADEFVYYPNMIEKLEDLKSKGVKKVRCLGFTVYHPTFPTTDGQIYDEVKLGWPDRGSTKTILFNPEIKIGWSQGRHLCHYNRQHNAFTDTGIKLIHFRYLGREYYEDKNKKNAISFKEDFDNRRYFFPDRTETRQSIKAPYEWYENNKNKTIRVVE